MSEQLEPTIMYVTTHGEYSNFGVSGVYSTKEKALASGCEEDRIEEYILDSEDFHAAMLRIGKKRFHVAMYRDGQAEWVRECESSANSDEPQIHIPRPPHKSYLTMEVWANDKQHAVKIANEYRTRAIAEGRWDPD